MGMGCLSHCWSFRKHLHNFKTLGSFDFLLFHFIRSLQFLLTLNGRRGDKVVSVLVLYYDDPSSNPAEVKIFIVNILWTYSEVWKERP